MKKPRCRHCGSRTKICKGSGTASVGKCHWEWLQAKVEQAYHEATSGQLVSRAYRSSEILEKALADIKAGRRGSE